MQEETSGKAVYKREAEIEDVAALMLELYVGLMSYVML